MPLRTDTLIPLVDDARRDIVDTLAGLRLHTVQTISRAWDGGATGRGTATDTRVTLDPKPKVATAPKRLVDGPGGKYREGDLVISRISATLAQAALDGGTLPAATEWYIGITPDGEAETLYRVVGDPEKRYLEWRLHVRPVRSR